jgi:hypothetical protein
MRIACALGMAALACGAAGAAHASAPASGFELSARVASFAAPVAAAVAGDPLAFALHRRAKPATAPPSRADANLGLGAERARILLRSLTVPGWGQATLGHRTAASVFLVAETGVWASFTAFHVQEILRRENYERTARIFAGIDLSGRDEEFRRIVGGYISSEEYNRLVVARDAANLYYNDPAAMRAYIAAHSLSGNNAWDWGTDENLLRYRGQRKDAQRAGLRANTALALAIVNRLVSAVHAAREAGTPARAHSWNLQMAPADGATAVRLGVARSF